MRKLLIVEDEWIIRKALVSLPWETIGVTQVLEAGNGEEGLSEALQHQPQVVLSDINMPFKDGLAMGREIIDHYACKIIFLTGYSEFSYAQAAIALKAYDYILKPVDQTVLLPQVDNAFQLLEEEQLVKQVSIDTQRRTALRQLLYAENSFTNEQLVELFNLQLPYQCAFSQIEEDQTRWKEQLPAMTIQLDDHSFFSVFQLKDHHNQFEGWQQDAGIMNQLRSNRGWVGFSTMATQVESFQQYVLQARHCFELNRLDEPGLYQYQLQRQLTSELPKLLVEFDRKLSAGIQQQVPQESLDYLLDIEKKSQFQHLPLTKIKPVVLKQLFMVIHANNYEQSKAEFDYYQEVNRSIQLTEVLEPLKQALQQWQLALQEDQKTVSIIQQAQQFVDQHYADERISLQVVADTIHVSPPYLSNLFKSETGKNYTEYLFEKRMQEAYRLLRTTEKSIADISAETGFNNANYFSSCFKKHSGLSPKQYRNQAKEQRE